MWRHTRSILRSEGIIQSRWRCTRNKLPFYGRLCRQRILQCRNIPSTFSTEGNLLNKVIQQLKILGPKFSKNSECRILQKSLMQIMQKRNLQNYAEIMWNAKLCENAKRNIMQIVK